MNGPETDVFIEWMSGEHPGYLKELEREARADGVPVIRRSAQSLLCFFSNLLKPDRVLEIGSGVGFSAVMMREYAGDGCRITGIELDPDRAEKAGRNIEKAGFARSIRIRCADAADVLPELAAHGEKYRMVFLDGPKGQYTQYLPYIEAMTEEGAVLIADNLLKEGEVLRSRYAVTRRDRTIHARMREFITQMTHSDRWQTMLVGDGDGMLAAVRKQDAGTAVRTGDHERG